MGIGALGCLFGARLSQHADVTLVGRWPKQLQALANSPLRIIAPNGTEETVQLHATNDVNTIETVETVLILTKSPRTYQAAQAAAQVLAPDGLAITLQNGLGNLEIMQDILGEQRSALGITTQGASVPGPGILRLGGTGPTYLATQPAIDEHVQALAKLFNQAGLETHIVDDVSALVWRKLAINAAINALTAILNIPNGALLASDHARQLMDAAAEETQTLAAAQGIILDNITTLIEEIAQRTGANHSSMLQDVSRHTKTEVEAINGAITRLGTQLGIETPINSLLYRLVKAIEDTYANRANH